MKKFISIFLIMLFCISLLYGCSTDYDRNVSIAVIGGRHGNSTHYDIPLIDFENDDKENAFLSTKDRVKQIFGVVADNKPIENYSEIDPVFFDNCETALNVERWDTIQNYVINFINDFSKQTADNDEVDTLSAFYNVANVFNQQNEVCCNRILVFDSGLCTDGALDFIENKDYKSLLLTDEEVTDEEVKSIVSNLNNKKELPDLSNTQIRWYGIGMVGGKQHELTKIQISNLTAIWKGILNEAGAQVDFINLNANNDESNDEDLPNVSVVMFDEAISLGEEELGFKEQSDEFLEGTEEKRQRVLNEFVREGKREGILLVGTTSSGGATVEDAEDFDLSERRAIAVKNELTKLGVPEYNIKSIGLGTKSHKYNPNEFVNGEYKGDSQAAVENRSVYIMSINSSESKEFINEYNELHSSGKI